MNSKEWIKTFESKKQDFIKAKQLLEKHQGSQKVLSNLVFENKRKIEEIESLLGFYIQVTYLLQQVSECTQKQISKVEQVCSAALREILNDPNLELKIKMEKKKGGIETSFYIYDKNVGEINLMKGEAGAVKNIIAVGLRLIFIELYNPKVEGPVILDEVGGHISTEYQESFGKFLRNFSNLVKRQIILVSHHKPVIAAASRKIIVSKEGNVSSVSIGQ